MKLYKFRPLTFVPEKFVDRDGKKEPIEVYFKKRIVPMLEGSFWFSKFWKLNDTLEGVYLTKNLPMVDNVFYEKNKYVILSLSGINALSEILMWGHYASGYHGIALEIEIDPTYLSQIYQIRYKNTILNMDNFNEDIIKSLLTQKGECRLYEDEFRILLKDYKFSNDQKEGDANIGKITGIYFGEPYQKLSYIADNKYYDDYKKLKEMIIKHISTNDIKCYNLNHQNDGSIQFDD